MTIAKVGIIGGGELGLAIARAMARAGVSTVISGEGSGEGFSALAHEFGGAVTVATLREAADEEIVFLAVPWDRLDETLSAIADWEGRIVIDATDPMLPDAKTADLGERTSTEIVSKQAPGAQVVKAFNALPPVILAKDPEANGGRRVIFFSGDHLRAKAEVGRLIARIGFFGIDLGTLAEGGRLQQFPGGPLWGVNLIRIDA